MHLQHRHQNRADRGAGEHDRLSDEGGNGASWTYGVCDRAALNEWIEGYEEQREQWESEYATAHDLWEEHKAFISKQRAAAEKSAAEDGQDQAEEEPAEEPAEEATANSYHSETKSEGTLASDDQLAALREKLMGEKN